MHNERLETLIEERYSSRSESTTFRGSSFLSVVKYVCVDKKSSGRMQRLFETRLFGIYIAFNVACTVISMGLGDIITILETFPRSITRIRIVT